MNDWFVSTVVLNHCLPQVVLISILQGFSSPDNTINLLASEHSDWMRTPLCAASQALNRRSLSSAKAGKVKANKERLRGRLYEVSILSDLA